MINLAFNISQPHCRIFKQIIFLEFLHGLLDNTLHTDRLEGNTDLNHADIEQFIIKAVWDLCSTQNTILGCSLGAAVFGRNMLHNLPYLAD